MICKHSKGCRYPINCTRRQECLALGNEITMSDNMDRPSDEDESTERRQAEYDVDPVHHFTSGASSSGNKPPYECLTSTLLRRAALRMQKGMHYGKHNWKKGVKDKAFILDRLNHALEHLKKAQEEIDSDTLYDDDDLAAVVVNCMMAMEYQSSLALRDIQGMYGGAAGAGKSEGLHYDKRVPVGPVKDFVTSIRPENYASKQVNTAPTPHLDSVLARAVSNMSITDLERMEELIHYHMNRINR